MELTYYAYSKTRKNITLAICALYFVVLVGWGLYYFIFGGSSPVFLLSSILNVIFIAYIAKAQFKVKINLENNQIMVRDKLFKFKPILVDIDGITKIDIVKSRKSGKVYRLLLRSGDNIFHRVIVKNPYEFLEQVSKINPSIVINEVFGAPV